MLLQVFYEIKKIKGKHKNNSHPNLSLIRPGLFWDTDINKINWERYKKSVIKRAFERGNEEEKSEIQRFYGNKTVKNILQELESYNL